MDNKNTFKDIYDKNNNNEGKKNNNTNNKLYKIDDNSFNNNSENISKDEAEGSEILMECYLIYRYTLNQIELDGLWGMTNDNLNEKLSYLFTKSNDRHIILIDKSDIYNAESGVNLIRTNILNNENCIKFKKDKVFFTTKDLENMYTVDLCAANLHEILLINQKSITNEILKYLSNEYCGYFVYFSKTIEDKFSLTLSMEESLVTIVGEGINSLGCFKIKGYMNLFKDKEELLRNNNLDDDFIRLGKLKMSRQYVVFNPNENYRLMKSYTHRKRASVIVNEDNNTFYKKSNNINKEENETKNSFNNYTEEFDY